MEIKLNTTILPEPSFFTVQWDYITEAGTTAFKRRFVLHWDAITAPLTATVLGIATAASYTITYIDPATNTTITRNVKTEFISAPVLSDPAGFITYAPLILKVIQT